MAPFRGGRGGRGSRGFRGSNRGRGDGRLARSGIKTKSGYRKFDSQRIRDVEQSQSDDEEPSLASADEEEGLSEEEEDQEQRRVKSYSTLLQSFRESDGQNSRPSKRRKVVVVADDEDAAGSGDPLDEDEDEIGVESGSEEEDENGLVEEDEEIEQPDGVTEAETQDASDPYETHFASPNDKELQDRIKSINKGQWRNEQHTLGRKGRLTVSKPGAAPARPIPKLTLRTVEEMQIKQRLLRTAKEHINELDTVQASVAPHLADYSDMLVTNRTPQNASTLRRLMCLHAINHILKGRDKVLKNNERLARLAEDAEVPEIRDQGFTRPKVLILLETRQMCARYVEEIATLFAPEQQENKKRFNDAFEREVEEREHWPDDYAELFAGNNDNNFLTALKFTRKTLKFYSAFYASDIIFASPLGLRRVLENEDPKKRDHDFLSSIEMVIVDQADAMQMQNWQNAEVVFEHLNLELKEAHGCDFSRVRNWYLDGNAKHLRQTIILSAYLTPEMNRLYNTTLVNIAGKVKITTEHEGAITSIPRGLKQTFSRFDAASPSADPDARFKYFTSAVLPSLLRMPRPAEGGQGILVFIPSYYDFLRIRNFFATSTTTQDISFGAIHDYSEVSEQRRARSHFLTGRHSILLYTQRAHHFFRLKIRGVKRVVMYNLPDNPIFYDEIVNGYLETSIQEGKISTEESGVKCIFSKWDGLRMERIVGSQRVKGMLSGLGDTFDFV